MTKFLDIHDAGPHPLHIHTDYESGALAAREAHDAGAVVSPVELPMHRVVIEFRTQPSEGLYARSLADWFAEEILNHPHVAGPVTVAVTER